MRIALITNDFPSISETFISNKVKALAARGHIIRVFTAKKNTALFNYLFTDISAISVVEFTVQRAVFYNATHPFACLKSIMQINKKRYLFNVYKLSAIRQFKPDIIHVEFSGIGIEYLPVLQKINCKKVVSCRGSAEKVKLLVDAERKKYFIQLMQLADGIHCVSADMRNTIEQYADGNKIFINYPSIDTDFFNRATPYNVNQVPVVISIGRFTFQKNYLTGLLAMRRVADAGFAFKWIIIGSGPQHDEIIFHIHQLQLQNYVELAGSKTSKEVKDLLEHADIFLLCSVYEGIANAALEAMSMQLPVVSTTCGGMPEVITCGKDGLLAGVYNDDRITAHIMYLIRHPAAAQAMGVAARARILEKFTLEQQINTFEHFYNQLLTA